MSRQKHATREDVLRAIEAGRLRIDVDAGVALIRMGTGPTAKPWRRAKLEAVGGPHQRERPYYRFNFGGLFRCLIHRAVWFVKFGEIPEGYEVNHKDGEKSRNGWRNLELATSEQNQAHAVAMGLVVHPRGRAMSSRAKLSEESVRAIRASNDGQEVLAARHGVTHSQVSRVRARKNYAWVE